MGAGDSKSGLHGCVASAFSHWAIFQAYFIFLQLPPHVYYVLQIYLMYVDLGYSF